MSTSCSATVPALPTRWLNCWVRNTLILSWRLHFSRTELRQPRAWWSSNPCWSEWRRVPHWQVQAALLLSTLKIGRSILKRRFSAKSIAFKRSKPEPWELWRSQGALPFPWPPRNQARKLDCIGIILRVTWRRSLSLMSWSERWESEVWDCDTTFYDSQVARRYTAGTKLSLTLSTLQIKPDHIIIILQVVSNKILFSIYIRDQIIVSTRIWIHFGIRRSLRICNRFRDRSFPQNILRIILTSRVIKSFWDLFLVQRQQTKLNRYKKLNK